MSIVTVRLVLPGAVLLKPHCEHLDFIPKIYNIYFYIHVNCKAGFTWQLALFF